MARGGRFWWPGAAASGGQGRPLPVTKGSLSLPTATIGQKLTALLLAVLRLLL
jgi:hypothetical protein